MDNYLIDLHVHTVLSPCAHILMTPYNIMKKAKKIGIDMLAVTDHNSAGNVEAAVEIGKEMGIKVVPGMEVETREEVHVLCLFEETAAVLGLEQLIVSRLPNLQNKPEVFGYQLLTDAGGDFIEQEPQLLATATDIGLNELVREVRAAGGYVIPSHILRKNGLVTNLGLIPSDLNLQILEIERHKTRVQLKQEYPFLDKFSLIKNSDSHFLKDLKPFHSLKLPDLKLSGVMKKLILNN